MNYGERRERYPSVSPEVASRLDVLRAALDELPATSRLSEENANANVGRVVEYVSTTDTPPPANVIALTTQEMRNQLNAGVSEAFGSIAA